MASDALRMPGLSQGRLVFLIFLRVARTASVLFSLHVHQLFLFLVIHVMARITSTLHGIDMREMIEFGREAFDRPVFHSLDMAFPACQLKIIRIDLGPGIRAGQDEMHTVAGRAIGHLKVAGHGLQAMIIVDEGRSSPGR